MQVDGIHAIVRKHCHEVSFMTHKGDIQEAIAEISPCSSLDDLRTKNPQWLDQALEKVTVLALTWSSSALLRSAHVTKETTSHPLQ